MSIKAVVAVLVVIGLLCGLMFYMGRSGNPGITQNAPPTLPWQPDNHFATDKLAAQFQELIKLSPSPPAGNSKAPWTVIEIGDFQCPQCGRATPLVRFTIQNSHGKAKLYFVSWPLTKIHPHALLAAEAAQSASVQDKFWPMYDLLYSHQDELIPSEIEYYARSIQGLDTNKLTADLTSNKYLPDVQRQANYVASIGTIFTPTFLVRSPKGEVTWYVGNTGMPAKDGHPAQPGVATLAAAPPWGGGIGMTAALKMIPPVQQPGTSSEE